MSSLIISGIIAGLGVSLLVGPLFFGLIQLSVERGVWAGIVFASGIWISDLLYVSLVQLGLGYIGSDAAFVLTFGIVGAIILFGLGIGIYLSPIKKGNLKVNSVSDYTSYFAEGMAINIFNPFVFLLWITILTTYQNRPMNEQWTFVAAMLSVVAICDIGKAYGAHKLGDALQEKHLVLIKKTAGVLISIFGVLLLIRSLYSVLNQ